MHATIDVRFEFSSDDEKMLPVAALAEFVTDQDVEATILEAIIEQLDVQRVEDYCGEKHAQGNGDNRFQRAGTRTRSAVTTAGEIAPTLHYVEDAPADQDESTYFRPVEDVTLRSVDRAIPDGQGAPTHRHCWADAYGAPDWFLEAG